MTEETARTWTDKLPAIVLIVFVLFLVGISTWMLFSGNIAGAFSALPFLLIIYLFVMRRR